MADFFQTQLDFIFFVYGLAFVLLGVVCFTIRRHTHWVLPWSYLGLFGFTHGLNEWLDLLAFTLGDTHGFAWFRLAVLTASFAFLVEFGRIGSTRLKRWAPGRWVFLPLLLLAALGGYVSGQAGINGAVRYGLGLFGCLWTAWVLFHRAVELEEKSRRWLVAAGLSAVGYGLATGLVVPPSGFLFAPFLNTQNFFAVASLPVQLVRAAFACAIAFAVWGYEQQRFDESVLSGRRRSFFSLTTFALALVIGCGWLLTEGLGAIYRNDLQTRVKADLALVTERLTSAMASARGLATAMSGSPALADLDAPTQSLRINSVVDRYSSVGPGLTALITDGHGTVIAASNRHTPASAVGKKYALPPVLLETAAARQEQRVAIGFSSGEQDLYASAPIRNARDSTMGIAVVKKRLSAVELGLVHFPHAFLIDGRGAVLLASDPDAPEALWPDTARPRSHATAVPPLLAPAPLSDGDRVTLDGKRHVVGMQAIPAQGWSVVMLREEKTTLVSRLFGIMVTLLISGLILLSSLMLQREMGTEMQFHRDQKRLEELSQRLEWQAITDNLTGAYNRLKFNEVIAAEIERAGRYDTPLSLVMYDIDYFKQVNDTYGHQVGDTVLVELTRLVSAHIRESDLLARWGGEEFMIIAPQSTCADAVVLAEKLRHKIERHPFAEVGHVTCSFGVVSFTFGDKPENLAARCDKALYKAKTSGRNRVEAMCP